MDKQYRYFKSPIGTIELIANNQALLTVHFVDDSIHEIRRNDNSPILEQAYNQLSEYFSSQRVRFDVPIDLSSGTDFQQKVWKVVADIPLGKTITYTKLAQKLGSEKLVRAVGTANGKNPYLLIIPCHRIIGSGNKLIGYAGGLWRKQWLLEHEIKENKLIF